MKQVMDAVAVARALRRIAHEIIEAGDARAVVLCGVPTRGVPLAHRLSSDVEDIAGLRPPVVEIDIGPYRDDIDVRSRSISQPKRPSGDVTGRRVVLVDDVVYTGRTVRAALDAVADLGRPGRMEVAVLVDRGHREVPIRPDYVGKNLPTSVQERIAVRLLECDDREGVFVEEAVGAEGRRP